MITYILVKKGKKYFIKLSIKKLKWEANPLRDNPGIVIQFDIRLREVKDFIKDEKWNGYK